MADKKGSNVFIPTNGDDGTAITPSIRDYEWNMWKQMGLVPGIEPDKRYFLPPTDQYGIVQVEPRLLIPKKDYDEMVGGNWVD